MPATKPKRDRFDRMTMAELGAVIAEARGYCGKAALARAARILSEDADRRHPPNARTGGE